MVFFGIVWNKHVLVNTNNEFCLWCRESIKLYYTKWQTYVRWKRSNSYLYGNAKQPIQLKSNSYCQENINITDKKVSFNGTRLGGNITVGGGWFTELTFQHNGEGAGSLINFCLDNAVVQ